MSRPLVYSEMYFVGAVSAMGIDMYWKLFSLTKMVGTFRFLHSSSDGAEVVRRGCRAVAEKRDGDLLRFTRTMRAHRRAGRHVVAGADDPVHAHDAPWTCR